MLRLGMKLTDEKSIIGRILDDVCARVVKTQPYMPRGHDVAVGRLRAANQRTSHYRRDSACVSLGKDYSVGTSPQGPTFKVGNLALHLTRGHYSDQVHRPARIAVYDSRADASRVFLSTGYQFEVSRRDSTFLILNWTGTMGDQELTLFQLELSQTDGYWRIAQITMTQHGTKRNSTIRDVAPWAKDCHDARENPRRSPQRT